MMRKISNTFSLLCMILLLMACKSSSETETAQTADTTQQSTPTQSVNTTQKTNITATDLPENLLYGEDEGLVSVIKYSYENHVGAWNPSEVILRNQEAFTNYLNNNRSQSQCWYIGDSYNPDKKLPQWAIIELTKPKTINYIGIFSSEYYSGEGYSNRHVKDVQVWVSTTDTENFEKVLPITLYSNRYFEVFKIEAKENVKYIKYLVQSNYGHKESAIAPIVAFYDETPATPIKERLLAGKADVYNIFFGFESAAVRPESEPMLQQIVEILKTDATKTIEITVHNDARKDESKNVKLTQERADALKNRLKSAGIDEKRIVAKGAGASEAIASNENEYDRSKNRRVSIWIK